MTITVIHYYYYYYYHIIIRWWPYQIFEHLIFLHKSKRWQCILQRQVSTEDSFLSMQIPCLPRVESWKRSNVHLNAQPNAPVTVNVSKSFTAQSFLWSKRLFLSRSWRWGHRKAGRDCPRGKGSYGLTLIRLQSAKDQWVGRSNARTDRHGAPDEARGWTTERAVPTIHALRATTKSHWMAGAIFPFFYAGISLSCHARLRRQMRWTTKCRNVGPFRAKRIISV